MTQDNINDSSISNKNFNDKTKPNYKNNLLIKIFIIILACFLVYFINKNLQIQDIDIAKKITNLANDNFSKDSDILDISEELKNKNEATIHDLNVSEMKEKGAEFVYQIIIKNQNQIEELKSQITDLKLQFSKIKNYEKLNNIIIRYLEFRDKLFENQCSNNCDSSIDSFSLIIINDKFLIQKFDAIKDNFKQFPTAKKIINDYKILRKELLINKNNDSKNNNILDKIYLQLRKIVVIRKLSNFSLDQIEGQVNQINKHLDNLEYIEALNLLNNINFDKDNIIYKSFIEQLNIAIKVRDADKEIINYLKNLQ